MEQTQQTTNEHVQKKDAYAGRCLVVVVLQVTDSPLLLITTVCLLERYSLPAAMKFRALNFDYNAEARLEWAEDEKQRRSDSEPPTILLLRAGCYEKEESKKPQIKPPDPKIASVDPVETMEIDNDKSIPVDTAPPPPPPTSPPPMTNDGPTADTLMGDVEPHANPDVVIPMEINEDADTSAAKKRSGCAETATVPRDKTKAKAKYKPPLLSAAELQDFFQRLYRVSHTARLANEPWHDRVAQHFPFRQFWREPRDFLPAAISHETDARNFFQHIKPSHSSSLSSKHIKTVARSLGHKLQLTDGGAGSVSEKQSFSFSLLNVLRGGAGSFGLRRIKKTECKDRLDVERGAIVPYTGPRVHDSPPPKQEIIPSPQVVWAAVQFAMAAMQQQNGTTPDGNETTSKASKCASDKISSDQGCGGFVEYVRSKKKRPRESALAPAHSRNTGPSLQVSFADDATHCNSKQATIAGVNNSGRTASNARADSPLPFLQLPVQDDNQVIELSAEKNREVILDSIASTDQPKSAKKKKRTAEEKAARKKQKKERKARKKEKRSQEKRRRSEDSGKGDTEAEAKRPKKSEDPAGTGSQTGANSPKRSVPLRRSVVPHQSSTASRRVSAVDGESEFEKTRAVLNNKNHENRAAFAQMKLPRSIHPRNAPHGASSSQVEQSIHGQRLVGGAARNSTAATCKPPPQRPHGAVPPFASNSFSTNGQFRPHQMPSRMQLHQRSVSAGNVMLDGPVSKPVRGIDRIINPCANQGYEVNQSRETAPSGGPTLNAQQPLRSIVGTAPNIGHSRLTQVRTRQNTGETTQQAKPPASDKKVAPERLRPLSLLCSEPFLESWGDVVAELASGRWKKDPHAPGRGINLVDTALVNSCGADIEAPGRCGLLVYSVSALEAASDAREIVLEIVTLAAIGRYKCLYIFLSYDTDISPAIAKHVTQMQCATIRSNGLPEAKITIKTTSPATIATALAQTIFRLSARGEDRALEDSIMKGVSDSRMQERARFLLDLIPVLSASGAIQILLLAQQLLPRRSPYFRLVRQKITRKVKVDYPNDF